MGQHGVPQVGPVPHLPENGRVVAFGPKSNAAAEVASGGALLIDVARGRGAELYALADGTFTVLVDGLDRLTSMQFIGSTAYIVTLAGEIGTIADVAAPPFGR